MSDKLPKAHLEALAPRILEIATATGSLSLGFGEETPN